MSYNTGLEGGNGQTFAVSEMVSSNLKPMLLDNFNILINLKTTFFEILVYISLGTLATRIHHSLFQSHWKPETHVKWYKFITLALIGYK